MGVRWLAGAVLVQLAAAQAEAPPRVAPAVPTFADALRLAEHAPRIVASGGAIATPFSFAASGSGRPEADEYVRLDAHQYDRTDAHQFSHGETAAPGRPEAHQFGRLVVLDVDVRTHGEWVTNASGTARTWHAVVQSPGAASLSLRFSSFRLPDTAELYVIGPRRTLGAFTGAQNGTAGGRFATAPLEGDTLVLSLWQVLRRAVAGPALQRLPADARDALARLAAEDDALTLRVSGVVHGWEALGGGDAGPCHVDAPCAAGRAAAPALRALGRAVGVLITDEGQRRCTGTLLNNARGDGRQLFLTAEHCLPPGDAGAAAAADYLVAFNWRRADCAGAGSAARGAMQAVHGLRLLARSAATDYALLEILEAIPDAYGVHWAGWSRAADAPEDVACVHHPAGDVLKVSHYAGQAAQASWAPGGPRDHWAVPGWHVGGTERGSSGSPLARLSDGAVVGHLHGGTSSCAAPGGRDVFGALAFGWAAGLAAHLDPDGEDALEVGGADYASVSHDGHVFRVPAAPFRKVVATSRDRDAMAALHAQSLLSDPEQ